MSNGHFVMILPRCKRTESISRGCISIFLVCREDVVCGATRVGGRGAGAAGHGGVRGCHAGGRARDAQNCVCGHDRE